MSSFSLSRSSLEHRKGVDPRLIEIDDLAIQLTLVDYGHDKFAGKRSTDTQSSMYLSGVSECDGVIRVSKHQYGKALDFYAFVDGKASWEPEHLAMVACAYFQAASILGYKIRWGGLWKSRNPQMSNGIPYGWDMPHIELLEED